MVISGVLIVALRMRALRMRDSNGYRIANIQRLDFACDVKQAFDHKGYLLFSGFPVTG